MGGDLTPTQWAALSKLAEVGSCSQNQLGRLTAMDVATIKGVIDRLTLRGLTKTNADPDDGRRLLVTLTPAGRQKVTKVVAKAFRATEDTLAPLDPAERQTLKALLAKLR
jgi:DNA-binding MarR family transcriptional regulator